MIFEICMHFPKIVRKIFEFCLILIVYFTGNRISVSARNAKLIAVELLWLSTVLSTVLHRVDVAVLYDYDM